MLRGMHRVSLGVFLFLSLFCQLAPPENRFDSVREGGLLTQLGLTAIDPFQCSYFPRQDQIVGILDRLEVDCNRALSETNFLVRFRLQNPRLQNLTLDKRSETAWTLRFQEIEDEGFHVFQMSALESHLGNRVPSGEHRVILHREAPKIHWENFQAQNDYTLFSNQYWDFRSTEPILDLGLPTVSGSLGNAIRLRSITEIDSRRFRIFFRTTFSDNNPGEIILHFQNGRDASGMRVDERFSVSIRGLRPGPSLAEPRRFHFIHPYSDGRILVGYGFFSDSSFEVWSPGMTSFRKFLSTPYKANSDQTLSVLPDETILLVGGVDANDVAISQVQRFDPRLDRITNLNPLPVARRGHTTTVLQDGRVLIANGRSANLSDTSTPNLNNAVLFDPNANSGLGSYSAPIATNHPRFLGCAVLLNDGRVWLTGGADRGLAVQFIISEFYLPNTNQFVLGPTIPVSTLAHRCYLLDNGSVLITPSIQNLQSNLYLIFDPSTNAIRTLPLPKAQRSGAAVAILDPESFFVFGGGVHPVPTEDARLIEKYDGATTRTFLEMGMDLRARRGHEAVRLSNGSFLITGGVNTEFTALRETQFYGNPPSP